MVLEPLNDSNPTPSRTFSLPVGSIRGVSIDYGHGVLVDYGLGVPVEYVHGVPADYVHGVPVNYARGVPVSSAHDVRATLELSFNPRFSSALHVGKHRLAKVPAEKLIDRPKWITKELLIEMTTGNVKRAGSRREAHDLIIILHAIVSRE